MAGVLNTTKRQFNLREMMAGRRVVTVRLIPGLNNVPDEIWGKFNNNKFVLDRISKGQIVHGDAITQRLHDEDPAGITKIRNEKRQDLSAKKETVPSLALPISVPGRG